MKAVYSSRVEEFRIANFIDVRSWYQTAGISRAAFRVVRLGSDPYVSTARRLIVSASVLIGRQVRAQELWNVGEDQPPPRSIATAAHPVLSPKQRMALKSYETHLDRVLRAEGLVPCFFPAEAGMTRQSLQRLRAAVSEPCLSTIAQIVLTLRRVTGKPYKAQHVFEVGETLPAEDPLAKQRDA